MRRTVAIATLVTLPLVTLAACGGDDDDAGSTPTTEAAGGPPPAGAVTVVAEDIAFTESSYEAPAGEVTFVYENRDSIRHTLVIDGVDEGTFKLEISDEGDTDQGDAELEPGDYELICDVPGHGAMRATLTVG